MGHCKDCQFWTSYRNRMICDQAAYTDEIDPSPCSAYVHAEAADDWGLDAALVTGPEFGCVKFYQKKS